MRTRTRWRTAGRRLVLAPGDLFNIAELSRRIPLLMLLLHTTLLYVHGPGLRRLLTSLVAMTTMAAGRRDTPGSPTEHVWKAMHGSGRIRPTDRLQVIVKPGFRPLCGTLVLSKLYLRQRSATSTSLVSSAHRICTASDVLLADNKPTESVVRARRTRQTGTERPLNGNDILTRLPTSITHHASTNDKREEHESTHDALRSSLSDWITPLHLTVQPF